MTNVPGRKRSQITRGARSLAGFVLLALALNAVASGLHKEVLTRFVHPTVTVRARAPGRPCP
jgi:hypothetical protein